MSFFEWFIIYNVLWFTCTFRDHQISHCIVIKHLLPHGHNVEENGDCGEEIPAKRPTRNLKVW